MSFVGPTGVRHSVEVLSESLYEAAILGVTQRQTLRLGSDAGSVSAVITESAKVVDKGGGVHRLTFRHGSHPKISFAEERVHSSRLGSPFGSTLAMRRADDDDRGGRFIAHAPSPRPCRPPNPSTIHNAARTLIAKVMIPGQWPFTGSTRAARSSVARCRS